MKKHILILTSITLFIATSCTKQPEACFTTPSYEVKTNENVAFTNCSQNAHSYEWNFGDGTSLNTEENPNHTFTSPGSYNVSLRAYSKNEKKSNEFVFAISVIENTTDTTNNDQSSYNYAGTYSRTQTHNTYVTQDYGNGDTTVLNTYNIGGQVNIDQPEDQKIRLENLSYFSNVVFLINDTLLTIQSQSQFIGGVNKTLTGTGNIPFEDQIIFNYTITNDSGDTTDFGTWDGIKQ